MDNLRSPQISWAYYNQGKGLEELKHSLFCTTLELESTRMAAEEEIRRKEDQVNQLKDLLNKVIRERDDTQDKCQRLLLEKVLLLQQLQQNHQHHNNQTTPLSGISSIDEEQPRRGGDSNTGISSDCEESILSSPVVDPIQASPLPPPPLLLPPMLQTVELTPDKPLPEKGKLLQAVMKAGPLLQTLLLAGPLPQWRHPPPPLDSFEIPPVVIPSPHLLHQDSHISFNDTITTTTNSCGSLNKKKRSLVVCEGSDSSTNSKYQRVLLH